MLHMRRYFAAVAPPYPPPMTMTRPTGLDGAEGSVAQAGRSDAAARAPEVLRKSRRGGRFMAASYLAFCAEKYAASASICSSVEPLGSWGMMACGRLRV